MSLRSVHLRLALLVAVTISCNDTVTGPATVVPDGAIVLGDSVLTRGAVLRASVEAPLGYIVVPGSVVWEVSGASAAFVGGSGQADSVDLSLGAAGSLQLTARYRVRGQAGAGSSVTIVGPSSRSASDVRVEATRALVVASPSLDYQVLPAASVTAGASLGDVQVAFKDIRGRILTGLTDSVVIALDPASGTAGATLLGAVRARAVAGVATFSGNAIQRAGVGYRLIASSPTTAGRDTALTTVVAGAASAAQSTFTVTDTILSVGAGTTVTVTLRDQFGNPVLTATPAAFTPTKTDGTLGTFTCANGVCTSTYTAPTVPGGQTLGATIGGTAIPGAPRPVSVRAGAAARLKITGDTTQVAGATNLIVVTAFDAFGNVATAYAGTKRLTFSGAAVAPVGTVPKIGAANVQTDVDLTFEAGVARLVSSVLVKAERAVLATTDGTLTTAGDDRLPVRVVAAVPDGRQSTIVVADSARVGGQTTVVTITLRDAYGNPVLDGNADSFTPTVSGGTLSAFTCTLGVCTATYTAPPANGPQTITAAIGGTPVAPVGTSVVQVTYDNIAPAITGPSGAAGDAATSKSVPENTTAVHTFTANEAATWALDGGADVARFAIDPATGALVFRAAPDFEAPTDADRDNRYIVVVTATDGTGNISRQTVTVSVVDLTAPAITGPSGAAGDAAAATSVVENTTAVHSFVANEPVTWSISGGADAARFTIDAAGVLTFVAAPDFEAPADADRDNAYVVTVRAVDAAGNVSTQTITVTVTDADEIAPVITGPSGAAGAPASAKSLPENTVAVHTFTASEGVTWTLGGVDAARFAIDPTTGALTFVTAPDFERPADADGNNTYLVTVTATDAAGNVASQTLTVTITNLDESFPQITGPSGAAGDAASAKSIPENTTAVHRFTASEEVTWGLDGGEDAALFAIDQVTGTLVFRAAPDFERPTDTDTNNRYLVIVSATDPAGNVSRQTVSVTVTDVDEVPPVLTGPSGGAGSPTSARSLEENRTAVTTFTANEPVTWSIGGGADALAFAIDPTTGALTFVAAPDFENPTDVGRDNTYVVTIRGTDAAGNVTTQTLTVTITNVDETAPRIQGPTGALGAAASAASVPEGTIPVYRFTASEDVTWALAAGTDVGAFVINPFSGQLDFRTAPDFENPTDVGRDNAYVVEVTATDPAGNVSLQTVTVTVTDVDEVAPVITGPSGAGVDPSATTIPENTTAVFSFTANEAVTWSLEGGEDAAKFAIAPNGVVTFLVAPDFERPTDGSTSGANTYIVVIKAVDALGNVSRQTLTVTVTDADENPPVITGPSGAAGDAASVKSVPENQTAVHTFTATDAAAVTWRISGGEDAATFAMTAGGVLTFVAAPDFEAPTDGATSGSNTYLVVVEARDAAGNIATQTVTVTVTDLDEVPPAITGPSGAAGAAASAKSIPENQTPVHTFTANEPVTWSIDGGADAAKFAIAADGSLTFLAAPDFENPSDADGNNTYVVTVKAVDARGNTSTQTLTVTITNVDERAPVITGPSGGAGAAASAKSIPEGTTAVHTFTSDDADQVWGLGTSADRARFAISASGALTFLTPPDFENPTDQGGDNIYVVVVTATDPAGNVSSQTVTVTVTDVDEIAPEIFGPGGVAGALTSAKSVPEGTTSVHTFTASESVTWAIDGGVDAARFALDPSTGALTFLVAPVFLSPIDADGNNTYIVVIKATDTANLVSRQTLTVTVTQLDVTAPVITGPSGGAGAGASATSIPENTTFVHTFSANESVTWSIVGGADQAKFSINAGTGTLSFITAPNFEAPTDAGTNNVYDVTIRATDGAGNVSSQTVAVTVTDVDETGLILTTSAQDIVAVNEVTERIIFYVRLAGVRTAVASPTTFNLTASGGGTFFSDVNGTTTVTSRTVAAGVDSFFVYYRQTTGAGTTTTLTATRSTGDVVATGTKTMQVVASAPAAQRLSGIICAATTSNSNSETLTPDTRNYPCTATAGQLLVMILSHSPTGNPYTMPAFTTPAGWTKLREEYVGTAANPKQLRTYIFYRVVTVSGNVGETFTLPPGDKVRSTYLIAAVNNPNGTPVDVDAVSSTLTPTAGITIPSASATRDNSMLLAYAVQDIGSNTYVAPAGLSTVGVAGNGGQAVTMILFSKDRQFSGPTRTFTVGTAQTANPATGGVILLGPQP